MRETTEWKGKRLEEQYKMIFKRGFKKTFEEFKQKNNLKGKKKEKQAEEKFFEEYFKNFFERKGISITFSHQPRKKASIAIPLFNPTTINSHYVEAVMSSPKFEQKFLEYVGSKFVRDYSRMREFKIKRVLEKCLQFFVQEPEKGEEEVVDYITRNKKCKLPWTNRELHQAIDSVRNVSSLGRSQNAAKGGKK